MVLKAKNGQEWTHPDPSHHSRSICTPQKHWHADYLWFFEVLASQASQGKEFWQKSDITNIWKVIFLFAQRIFVLKLVS